MEEELAVRERVAVHRPTRREAVLRPTRVEEIPPRDSGGKKERAVRRDALRPGERQGMMQTQAHRRHETNRAVIRDAVRPDLKCKRSGEAGRDGGGAMNNADNETEAHEPRLTLGGEPGPPWVRSA